MHSLAERLRHSVVPAVPAPFDSRGRLDIAATRQYARWMARQSVGAVAVWAHTGRGLLLSDIDRAQTLEVWREEMAGVPIVCGVGAPSAAALPNDPTARTDRVIDLTVSLARAAKEGGASGLLVYPPTALRGFADCDGRVVAIHRAVAEVGLPLIAFYLYEEAGGISYSLDSIAEVLDLPGAIGIKVATLDSVIAHQDVAAAVLEWQGPLLISGEDRFLGYSLMLGAQAALVGIAAACTDVSSALLASWYARDLQRFAVLSAALDAFSRITFTEPMDCYVQRMLWSLEADGVIAEGATDPFGLGTAGEERVAVDRAVRALRGS